MEVGYAGVVEIIQKDRQLSFNSRFPNPIWRIRFRIYYYELESYLNNRIR
jgi:hypothetical protein